MSIPYGPDGSMKPAPSMSRRNQIILAERLRWPDGALETCQDLENRHPGWRVAWLGENTIPGWERPGGYWALYEAAVHSAEVFRPELAELVAVISEEIPEHSVSMGGCFWCGVHGWRRPVRL